MADKLTGGLASGITLDKLVSNFTVGGLDRSTDKAMRRTVGGAYVAAALGNLDWEAGKLFAETVGGAKLTLAAKGKISQSVGGYHALTVGGAIMRKAEGDMSFAAPSSRLHVATLASLSTKQKLELMAETITVEAQRVLHLHAKDDAVIELKQGVATLKGKVELDADTKIVVTGTPDDLTKG
jgi:hypothetical protein